MTNRQQLDKAKRWVIKIGSALLTADGQGLDARAVSDWVDQIALLARSGKEIVLVSSGAVAEGLTRLGWEKRPKAVHNLQAAAAVGQMGLIQIYESNFQRYGMHTAQILLVHDDLAHRQRYLNARSTLQTLIRLKVIPVVNENDTVVTDEIRFGDNDTLAALVANLIDADCLMILTDQNGLFEHDPRKVPDAPLIAEAKVDDPQLDAVASGGAGQLGRGGMVTKVRAARLAARSGTFTIIAGGREPQVIQRVFDGEDIGTLLVPEQRPINARKQWLAGHLQAGGALVLDEGAVNMLRNSGKSLLPVGVKEVRGEFARGAMVVCLNEAGEEIARGLVNYSSNDTERIIGYSSDEIERLIGYCDEDELIHRDNMVVK